MAVRRILLFLFLISGLTLGCTARGNANATGDIPTTETLRGRIIFAGSTTVCER